MGKKISIYLISGWIGLSVFGQEMKPASDSLPGKKWEFSATANLYFLNDDFFVLPIITADKGKLHLEARYNYEDRKTTSIWGGMNFHFGDALSVDATPMAGVVFGNSNGLAPGLELTMTYKRFEWYSEGEYFLSTEDINENYGYLWTDLTYSPTDWFSFGISGQRTRLYQTSLDIQRGLLATFAYKNAELSGYWYNIGQGSSTFGIVSLAYHF